MEKEPKRFMYHNFPRRKDGEDVIRKGLEILRLIVNYGLLLTTEVVKWKDRKIDDSIPEEFTQIGTRCCFTELSESEVEQHSKHFGPFALEFDHQTLINLGAMPVMYMPKMSDYEDYGIGSAIVTQLGHIQEIMTKLTLVQKFAIAGYKKNPNATLFSELLDDGGLIIGIKDTSIRCTIPKDLIDLAKKANPVFELPKIPENGAMINTQGLLTLINMLSWGNHKFEILTRMIKGLAAIIYPTERKDDPLLYYYMQREWRLIAGYIRENVKLTNEIPTDLRAALLELDNNFFARNLPLPTGDIARIDMCQLYSHDYIGEPISKLIRRIICPSEVIEEVSNIMKDTSTQIVAYSKLGN